MTGTAACRICGKPTTTKRSRSCAGAECRRAILNQDQREFQRRYRERTGKGYRAQFPAARTKACASCETQFSATRSQRYCCAECRSAAFQKRADERARIRAEQLLPVVYQGDPYAHLERRPAQLGCSTSARFHPVWKACACKVCGAKFLAKQFYATCSVPCALEHRRNLKAAERAARRVREHAARVPGEYVNRRRVFRRDRYICGLCGAPTVSGADPNLEPTIDHRVPVSRGGKHTYANCQTAHHICNSRKCDADSTTFLASPAGLSAGTN